ncbi:urea ABC transporter permease subunit UrtB [Teredinibacter waterburyi]|uniref:urea ABC transporter permease subunit UrtB n=1 Tax=Teredinibacter waterburyi TaxID=1500538 RepID=UPI00165F6BFB|nr:urea ABC transporter permease subunit UrtB [Teredinibacter waterburyi]
MGEYTYSELGSILAMQGFAGISLFSVLLLMALGLAIIFGQMGVINMAHGEFMAVGAYTTYFMSSLTESYLPTLMPYYFLIAILLSFLVAGLLGYLAEFALIRHLYKRPLDTLLATWGLSLIMQQSFRSIFGAREVSPTLPDWLMGSYQPTETIDIPLNGMFVLALTAVVTLGVFYLLFKSSWGLRVRATTQNRIMSGAVGINTKKIDRYTFALGCGIAGIAGAAFTTIASTGPTTGSLYIVDTFMVVVFGGAASLFGTIASAFSIAQAQSILEFFISGSMAKVYTLLALVIILMFKPEGLFASKVRR